jgi:FkbM family methyltransferase
MPVTGSEITSLVNLEECFPEQVSTEERIEMATRCHDMASVPKVQKAGRIETLEDGTRAQIMHNGLLVLADSYQGPWMTTLIERCGGYHEPQEERVFYEVMKRIGENATMIELGGYWAFYSLWFLAGGSQRRAIVLEPDPKHLQVGQKNASLNGYELIFIHGFAGRKPSPPTLFMTANSGQVMAPCLCVPLLMEQHGIEHLDIMHSDIQGAEFDVLLSCRELFESQRISFVFVSTHAFKFTGDPLTHQRCLQIIRNLGGQIIAEHDVHESFSGDGLIVAYFGKDIRCSEPVNLSRNRYSESYFRNPIYDLAAAQTRIRALELDTAKLRDDLDAETNRAAKLLKSFHEEQSQTARLRYNARADQARLENSLLALRQCEAELAVPAVIRTLRWSTRKLRRAGDRLTGGGVRALAKRVLDSKVFTEKG